MANCPDCGAEVIWAVNEKDEKVPLDRVEMKSEGEGRYLVKSWADPIKVEPVVKEYAAPTYVDHRQICQTGRPT